MADIARPSSKHPGTLWDVVDRGRVGTVTAVAGALAMLLVASIVCGSLLAVIPWATVEYARARQATREVERLRQMAYIKSNPGESNPTVEGWPEAEQLEQQLAIARSRQATPTPILPFLPLPLLTVAGAYIFSIGRREPDLRRRLGAVPINAAEHPRTLKVLAEMAIAAGEPFPPRLFVFESDAMNAAITGRRATPAFIVCVTSRFLELSEREQRAAFANLLSRKPSLRQTTLKAGAWFSIPFWWLASLDLTFGWRKFLRSPRSLTYCERLSFVYGPGALILLGSSAVWSLSTLMPYLHGRAATSFQPDFVVGTIVLALLCCMPIALIAVKALSFAQEATALLADKEGLLLSKEPGATFSGIARASQVGTTVRGCGAFGHHFWCSPLGDSYLGWKGYRAREHELELLAGVDGIGLRDGLPVVRDPSLQPIVRGQFPHLDAAVDRYRELSPGWPAAPSRILVLRDARPPGAIDACLRTGLIPGVGPTEIIFTEAMLADLTEDELLAVVASLVSRMTHPDPDSRVIELTGDVASLIRAREMAAAAAIAWPAEGLRNQFVFSEDPLRTPGPTATVAARRFTPRERWLLLLVPALFIVGSLAYTQLFLSTASPSLTVNADHSTVSVPLPAGATLVSGTTPLPDVASASFYVALPVSRVSEYYNAALEGGMLKSQGYHLWVNGWEGFDSPPTTPGQTSWPLVRDSGVGDGSLDELNISLTPTADGGTTIAVSASRWVNGDTQLSVIGVEEKH